MESEAIDWEQDLPLDADGAYRSLVRSLKRTDGFALLFVRCSPVQADLIISKVQSDLATKNIEKLQLLDSINNLYNIVDKLPNRNQINILFIKGLEYSIFAYEDQEMNDINRRSQSSIYGGNWKGVPKIFNHLNLSRERFRDNFSICFVFLVPEFVLNYFIRRAPDFFDWRSNIFEFPTEARIIDELSQQILTNTEWEIYPNLSEQQSREKKIHIRALYGEDSLSQDQKAQLFRELEIKPDYYEALIFRGNALFNLGRNEEAISSYDRALEVKPNYYLAWYNRGNVLKELGRYEEAIVSYDRALEFKPNKDEAWNNRGNALGNLGRYEEAISSYDRALEVRPDYYLAWYNRGNVLEELGRYEEAIVSYDRALEFKPNKDEAWNNRGIALGNLDRNEDAILSFDKALEYKRDDHEAWYNRGNALFNLGRNEEAIASYDRALEIKPNLHQSWNNRGNALFNLGRNEEAIASYDKALEYKRDDHEAWYNRGNALFNLGRNEEAIASYDRALEIKPDKHEAWYNKACAYSLQNKIELALKNLENVIQLNMEDCREQAKNDSDFDNIRHDPRFQALIQ